MACCDGQQTNSNTCRLLLQNLCHGCVSVWSSSLKQSPMQPSLRKCVEADRLRTLQLLVLTDVVKTHSVCCVPRAVAASPHQDKHVDYYNAPVRPDCRLLFRIYTGRSN